MSLLEFVAYTEHVRFVLFTPCYVTYTRAVGFKECVNLFINLAIIASQFYFIFKSLFLDFVNRVGSREWSGRIVKKNKINK